MYAYVTEMSNVVKPGLRWITVAHRCQDFPFAEDDHVREGFEH